MPLLHRIGDFIRSPAARSPLRTLFRTQTRTNRSTPRSTQPSQAESGATSESPEPVLTTDAALNPAQRRVPVSLHLCKVILAPNPHKMRRQHIPSQRAAGRYHPSNPPPFVPPCAPPCAAALTTVNRASPTALRILQLRPVRRISSQRKARPSPHPTSRSLHGSPGASAARTRSCRCTAPSHHHMLRMALLIEPRPRAPLPASP